MSGPTCETCPFWVADDSEETKHGYCRHSSPTRDGWPLTYYRDWCGDHPDRAPSPIALDTDPEPWSGCVVTDDNPHSVYCLTHAPADPALPSVLERAIALESALRGLMSEGHAHPSCAAKGTPSIARAKCSPACLAAQAALDGAPAPHTAEWPHHGLTLPVCIKCKRTPARRVYTPEPGGPRAYYVECWECRRRSDSADTPTRAAELWTEGNPPTPPDPEALR